MQIANIPFTILTLRVGMGVYVWHTAMSRAMQMWNIIEVGQAVWSYKEKSKRILLKEIA